MKVFNAYEDDRCADAYANLEFPGTYYLAYRDLPQLIAKHVKGKKAIDFGCGAGRSTRFLQKLGFTVTGVDISASMIKKAREMDPGDNYCLIEDGDLSQFKDQAYDLISSIFTFDNIAGMEWKIHLFRELRRLLRNEGKIVHLVSTPDMYIHEWASFSTKDYPENQTAKSGDIVKIINTASDYEKSVEDILCPDKDYRKVFRKAGLTMIKRYNPLAKGNEAHQWVNETEIAPWSIYVLKKGIEDWCARF